MKAIVLVSKKSSYGEHRFLTYPVKELTSKTVALDINGTTVDFGFGEVIIVDIVKEIEAARYRSPNELYSETQKRLERLQNLRLYKNTNGIKGTILDEPIVIAEQKPTISTKRGPDVTNINGCS